MQGSNNLNTETVSTLQYMAPEAMSQSVYSSASDIYSFGMLAYEVLFEKSAFGDLQGYDLTNGVVNNKMVPKMPSSFGRDDVKDILTACWRYNPIDRPDAGKICKRLMKVLKRLKKLETELSKN